MKTIVAIFIILAVSSCSEKPEDKALEFFKDAHINLNHEKLDSYVNPEFRERWKIGEQLAAFTEIYMKDESLRKAYSLQQKIAQPKVVETKQVNSNKMRVKISYRYLSTGPFRGFSKVDTLFEQIKKGLSEGRSVENVLGKFASKNSDYEKTFLKNEVDEYTLQKVNDEWFVHSLPGSSSQRYFESHMLSEKFISYAKDVAKKEKLLAKAKKHPVGMVIAKQLIQSGMPRFRAADAERCLDSRLNGMKYGEFKEKYEENERQNLIKSCLY